MHPESQARSLPAPFDQVLSAQTLDDEAASVCLLDTEGVIAFTNHAWDRFARDNGGPLAIGDVLVGTRWIDGIAGAEPRRLFGDAFARVIGGAATAPRTIVIDGHCHSPHDARDMVTQLVPVLTERRDRALGVLALYQVITAGAIEQRYPVEHAAPDRHRDAEGLLVQCFGCRRVRVRGEDIWDFVVEYQVTQLPSVSHGACPTCLELFYGRDLVHRARQRARLDEP